MITTFLNYAVLERFECESFEYTLPFPWINFSGLLTEDGFTILLQNFPSLDIFEEHRGLRRKFGQAPHDRYYLAYERSIHHTNDYVGKGVVRRADLPTCWQDFLEELNAEPYQRFIRSALAVPNYIPRYDWHVGVSGSEVSPHLDANVKIASHLFFFNTEADWDLAWGGQTLILSSKSSPVMNPRFNDFGNRFAVNILNNHSLFFKNTKHAWHGVEALASPEGKHRRLFNVIFEKPRSHNQPLSERANME